MTTLILMNHQIKVSPFKKYKIRDHQSQEPMSGYMTVCSQYQIHTLGLVAWFQYQNLVNFLSKFVLSMQRLSVNIFHLKETRFTLVAIVAKAHAVFLVRDWLLPWSLMESQASNRLRRNRAFPCLNRASIRHLPAWQRHSLRANRSVRPECAHHITSLSRKKFTKSRKAVE